MPSSPQSPERIQCPICRAEVTPDVGFCGACGSKLDETPAQEIRSLNYLLAELSRWEDEGIVGHEQASRLRENYESRREELRTQLAASRKRARPVAPMREATTFAPDELSRQHPPPKASRPSGRPAQRARTIDTPFARPLPPDFPPRAPKPRATRRALLEKLSDPHTIRVLLYTGAAMLVVGVVIWLRDILYLKLQEPIVQAMLLITGTTVITVAGWLTILRTRLLLTGRALTITGSLLVPVNFWFLVRSGLIENSGRAYLVCAFCSALYALTASFLRERLYVYLASAAAVSTAWTFIYRFEREAFGLYALALMAASLVFLHLSRLFPAGNDDEQQTKDNSQSEIRTPQSSLGYELWGPPLVHAALAGVTLSLFFYMPLRLGSSPSFTDGILRLRASHYDPSIAMLLFAAGAYATWFTGRHIFTGRRVLLYTMSALCLFWTEFLALDGLGLSGSTQLLLLATTTLALSLTARLLKDETYALAFHRASLIASVALAVVSYAVLSEATELTITHSVSIILLAATYALLSVPRFCEGALSATLAHASAIFGSIAFLVALKSLNLQSETLLYAAYALWPFALYAIARLAARSRRETQLCAPFMRIADAEFVLLLLFAAIVAFSLNQAPEERVLSVENLRGAVFCVLLAAVIYGALRCWHEHSFFGAAIVPLALFIETLIVLRVKSEWFAASSALALFPTFFVAGRYASARGVDWLARPSGVAADAVLALAAVASMAQASIYLRVGEPRLLAPCVALGMIALLSFAASLSAEDRARVGYFRAGLSVLILAFALACLRAGFDPLGDMEIYTTPIAILLLVVAYLFARRQGDEYASDARWLLWAGSLLLAAPLVMHALEYRLLRDVPAPWRDLATLCAGLALLIFGVMGRLRAPVLVGAGALILELAALALTSVDWLQIPLKVYLMSTGALILLIWGLLEFRREQILLMRKRFNERRETAREKFGEWK